MLEKILQLKEKFLKGRADAQDIRAIDGWLEEAKRLFLLKSLKEHDGVKYVYEIFESEILKINEVLKSKYSSELSDKERDRLLDKRDLAQRYVNLFKGVDDDLEKIEEAVEKELG